MRVQVIAAGYVLELDHAAARHLRRSIIMAFCSERTTVLAQCTPLASARCK